MKVQRRALAAGLAAGATALIAASAPADVLPNLEGVPHANLTILDPVWPTAYVARNHLHAYPLNTHGCDEKHPHSF